MTYVIRTRTTKLPDGSYISTDVLTEMPKAEALKAEASTEPGVEFNIIPADLARRYVARGMTHETALYVNADGFVRRARD